MTVCVRRIKQRVIPLHPYILPALRVAGLPSSGHLFIAKQGPRRPIRPETISTVLNRYLAGIGVEWTARSLRHRFATQLYQATGDLRLVQELLGHASPTTTAQYTQYAAGKAAGAIAALELPQPNRATRIPDDVRRSHPPAPVAVGRDLAALLPAFRAAQFAWATPRPRSTPTAGCSARSRRGWCRCRLLTRRRGSCSSSWCPRCRGDRVLASYLSRLRAFYGWAVALDIIDVDPTDALRRFQAAGMWPSS